MPSSRRQPPRPWQSALLFVGYGYVASFCFAPSVCHAQENLAPEIIGQQPLSVTSGSSLAITLEDLNVVDPDNSYPEEFTLKVSENSGGFQLSDNSITPDPGYEGSLEVTVQVNDGLNDSKPYTLTVDVVGTTGKGDGKDNGSNGGPGKDGDKGPGKDDEKKGGDKPAPGKDKDKDAPDKDKGGPGKDDKDKGGPGKDDKDKGGPGEDDKDKDGPGKDKDKDGPDKDKDKGPGKKDEEENGGPGKNKDDKKGGDDKPGGNNGGDNNGGGNGNGGDNGGGNNGGGNNGGGNSGGNNGGGNGNDGNNGGGNSGGGNNGGGNSGGGNNGGGNGNGGNNGGGGNNTGGNNPPPSNVAPVITGQYEITTAKNVSVTLDLNMLKVEDPDNAYPDDFSLRVFGGNNYTLDGNTVIPAQNFTGTFDVRVQVNDGMANSNAFMLRITVREGNIRPQILGQAALVTDEETPLSIEFDDLVVFDPDSPYPNGFTMKISEGEQYTTNNRLIQPSENFSGSLTVVVTIHDGKLESDPYPVIVTVNPINDAPLLENMERDVLPYLANAGPANITERIRVAEVDGDNIVGAEISFDMTTYQSGHDLLTFEPADETTLPIQGLFDADNGTLFLIGSAPASDYEKALRAVTYSFNHENLQTVEATTKTLSVMVRDGNSESNKVTREIAFSSEIALDVPQVFTPNGDMANDTWSVTPLQDSDRYNEATTRVYTIRGELLYEASGFEWEWDGKYQGQDLPTGTYYYVILVRSGINMGNRKGMVTILR